MKNFNLKIKDEQAPTWKFEDSYESIEEVTIRITEKLLTWEKDLSKFHITVNRIK